MNYSIYLWIIPWFLQVFAIDEFVLTIDDCMFNITEWFGIYSPICLNPVFAWDRKAFPEVWETPDVRKCMTHFLYFPYQCRYLEINGTSCRCISECTTFQYDNPASGIDYYNIAPHCGYCTDLVGTLEDSNETDTWSLYGFRNDRATYAAYTGGVLNTLSFNNETSFWEIYQFGNSVRYLYAYDEALHPADIQSTWYTAFQNTRMDQPAGYSILDNCTGPAPICSYITSLYTLPFTFNLSLFPCDTGVGTQWCEFDNAADARQFCDEHAGCTGFKIVEDPRKPGTFLHIPGSGEPYNDENYWQSGGLAELKQCNGTASLNMFLTNTSWASIPDTNCEPGTYINATVEMNACRIRCEADTRCLAFYHQNQECYLCMRSILVYNVGVSFTLNVRNQTLFYEQCTAATQGMDMISGYASWVAGADYPQGYFSVGTSVRFQLGMKYASLGRIAQECALRCQHGWVPAGVSGPGTVYRQCGWFQVVVDHGTNWCFLFQDDLPVYADEVSPAAEGYYIYKLLPARWTPSPTGAPVPAITDCYRYLPGFKCNDVINLHSSERICDIACSLEYDCGALEIPYDATRTPAPFYDRTTCLQFCPWNTTLYQHTVSDQPPHPTTLLVACSVDTSGFTHVGSIDDSSLDGFLDGNGYVSCGLGLTGLGCHLVQATLIDEPTTSCAELCYRYPTCQYFQINDAEGRCWIFDDTVVALLTEFHRDDAYSFFKLNEDRTTFNPSTAPSRTSSPTVSPTAEPCWRFFRGFQCNKTMEIPSSNSPSSQSCSSQCYDEERCSGFETPYDPLGPSAAPYNTSICQKYCAHDAEMFGENATDADVLVLRCTVEQVGFMHMSEVNDPMLNISGYGSINCELCGAPLYAMFTSDELWSCAEYCYRHPYCQYFQVMTISADGRIYARCWLFTAAMPHLYSEFVTDTLNHVYKLNVSRPLQPTVAPSHSPTILPTKRPSVPPSVAPSLTPSLPPVPSYSASHGCDILALYFPADSEGIEYGGYFDYYEILGDYSFNSKNLRSGFCNLTLPGWVRVINESTEKVGILCWPQNDMLTQFPNTWAYRYQTITESYAAPKGRIRCAEFSTDIDSCTVVVNGPLDVLEAAACFSEASMNCSANATGGVHLGKDVWACKGVWTEPGILNGVKRLCGWETRSCDSDAPVLASISEEECRSVVGFYPAYIEGRFFCNHGWHENNLWGCGDFTVNRSCTENITLWHPAFQQSTGWKGLEFPNTDQTAYYGGEPNGDIIGGVLCCAKTSPVTSMAPSRAPNFGRTVENSALPTYSPEVSLPTPAPTALPTAECTAEAMRRFDEERICDHIDNGTFLTYAELRIYVQNEIGLLKVNCLPSYVPNCPSYVNFCTLCNDLLYMTNGTIFPACRAECEGPKFQLGCAPYPPLFPTERCFGECMREAGIQDLQQCVRKPTVNPTAAPNAGYCSVNNLECPPSFGALVNPPSDCICRADGDDANGGCRLDPDNYITFYPSSDSLQVPHVMDLCFVPGSYVLANGTCPDGYSIPGDESSCLAATVLLQISKFIHDGPSSTMCAVRQDTVIFSPGGGELANDATDMLVCRCDDCIIDQTLNLILNDTIFSTATVILEMCSELFSPCICSTYTSLSESASEIRLTVVMRGAHVHVDHWLHQLHEDPCAYTHRESSGKLIPISFCLNLEENKAAAVTTRAANMTSEDSSKSLFLGSQYENNVAVLIIIGMTMGLLCLFTAACICWCFTNERKANKTLEKEATFIQMTQAGSPSSYPSTLPALTPVSPSSFRQAEEPWFMISKDDLEVLEVVGEGSYGKVHKGKYKYGLCAIKQYTCGKESLEEFMDGEANILCNVKPHPNILQVYGVCKDPGYEALIVEYFDGGSLDDLVYKQHGKSYNFDNTQKISILQQAASGVAHLHSLDPAIIHRDLAIRNLLVQLPSTSGNKCLKVVVCDFGLSRSVSTTGEDIAESNHTVNTVGPIRWFAPECITDAEYGTKSDVWAFGVLGYELFAEQLPYRHLTNVQVAVRVARQEEVLRCDPGWPEGVSRILRRCWQFEKKNRPTMLEIAEDLHRIRINCGTGTLDRRLLPLGEKSLIFYGERSAESLIDDAGGEYMQDMRSDLQVLEGRETAKRHPDNPLEQLSSRNKSFLEIKRLPDFGRNRGATGAYDDARDSEIQKQITGGEWAVEEAEKMENIYNDDAVDRLRSSEVSSFRERANTGVYVNTRSSEIVKQTSDNSVWDDRLSASQAGQYDEVRSSAFYKQLSGSYASAQERREREPTATFTGLYEDVQELFPSTLSAGDGAGAAALHSNVDISEPDDGSPVVQLSLSDKRNA